ncbi:MAG TPA: metallophosphoesterase [Gemmataceae bacterium]|nr:metallophosphoesterase [Gemmataceae bacterium]
MPDPDRILVTLRRAVQHFRDTPGRRGRFVSLEGASEVFVSGDLHGNLENFRRLLATANLAQYPRRHLVLQEVVHGPYHYPAGGDKSHQLLDLMAALKCQFPRQVHFLLGNHELAEYTQQRIAKGDLDLNQCFREGVGTAYGGRAPEVYAVYRELLGIVPLALRAPNRILLSHSLPPASRLETFDPAVLERDVSTESDVKPGGSVHALVWGRDTRAETAAAFLAKMDADLLISGHVPCDNGFDTPNDRQLILDSLGAVACYCLFPTDRPLTLAELVQNVHTL